MPTSLIAQVNPIDQLDSRGKPLMKSWKNTIIKLTTAGHLLAAYGSAEALVPRTNPYSACTRQLSPFAAGLYDWITSHDPVRKPFTRSDWDNARYMFNACWPDEYYDLID